MKGMDEFLELFGDVTVFQVVRVVLAFVFLIFVYKQIKKFFEKKFEEQHKRTEMEKVRNEQLEEALSAVRKYPEYRQQSVEIQRVLQDQIKDIGDRLGVIEEDTKRRERNKIRETLLQNHRYYTNPETNPSGSWTRVESETFWELYSEYEAADGNGYMHTDVVPDMKLLKVVDGNKK